MGEQVSVKDFERAQWFFLREKRKKKLKGGKKITEIYVGIDLKNKFGMEFDTSFLLSINIFNWIRVKKLINLYDLIFFF